MPAAPESALQVPCMSEKRGGQRQLPFFGSLVVGQPATQGVVVHADLRSNRFLSIVRFREIPLQRAQQFIRGNWTSFWQSTPSVICSRGRKSGPTFLRQDRESDAG
jgi:hypothetical protein